MGTILVLDDSLFHMRGGVGYTQQGEFVAVAHHTSLRMDQLKLREGLNEVYKCASCDYQSDIRSDWEDHYKSIHGLTVSPQDSDTPIIFKYGRIIGMMSSQLQQSGINIGPYDIIESELSTFAKIISNLNDGQKDLCRYFVT